jgi:hypothetical protein
MRESRTYGSGRGACDETHVPTATPPRVYFAPRRRGGMAARGAGAGTQAINLCATGLVARSCKVNLGGHVGATALTPPAIPGWAIRQFSLW